MQKPRIPRLSDSILSEKITLTITKLALYISCNPFEVVECMNEIMYDGCGDDDDTGWLPSTCGCKNILFVLFLIRFYFSLNFERLPDECDCLIIYF